MNESFRPPETYKNKESIWLTLLSILLMLLCVAAFLIFLPPMLLFWGTRIGFWLTVRKFYPYNLYIKGDCYTNKEQIEYIANHFKPWNYMIEREEVAVHNQLPDFFNHTYSTVGLHIRFRKEEDAVLFRMSTL